MRFSNKKVFFADYVFYVPENVYEPAEDSFVFAENLLVNEGDTVLDVGTGCGILGIIAARRASSVFAVDINPYAVCCAKDNARLNNVFDKMIFMQGDLFAPIKNEKTFDLVLFNAPYLPSDNTEGISWLSRAWSGGESGRQVIDRFIREVSKHLKKHGLVLLMQSTLADSDKTLQEFKENGFDATIVKKHDLPFFEAIVLFEAKCQK